MDTNLVAALFTVCNKTNKNKNAWFPIDEPILMNNGLQLIKCFNPHLQLYCYVNCDDGSKLTVEHFDLLLETSLNKE